MDDVHSQRERTFQRMTAIEIPEVLSVELAPPEPSQILYNDRYIRVVWGPLLGPAAVNTYLWLGDLAVTNRLVHPVVVEDLAKSIGIGWKGNNATIRYALRRLLMFRIIGQPDHANTPEHLVVPLSVRPVPPKQLAKIPTASVAFHRAYMGANMAGVR